MKVRSRAWVAATSLAMLALISSGCFNPFDPEVAAERAVTVLPPTPNTPKGLMQLFEWAYERQDITTYEELFTDDYRFAFAAEDSAGNPPLTREDELTVARNLFVAGSASEPPANKITLDYATDIVARQDPREGKDEVKNKLITVRVILTVETDDVIHKVEGKALFYVVRGDIAQIPEELQTRGLGPDPNRWYIERWEDFTGAIAGGGAEAVARTPGVARARPHGAAPEPARNLTWGTIKRAYLPARV
jgi:hypothetical protein